MPWHLWAFRLAALIPFFPVNAPKVTTVINYTRRENIGECWMFHRISAFRYELEERMRVSLLHAGQRKCSKLAYRRFVSNFSIVTAAGRGGGGRQWKRWAGWLPVRRQWRQRQRENATTAPPSGEKSNDDDRPTNLVHRSVDSGATSVVKTANRGLTGSTLTTPIIRQRGGKACVFVLWSIAQSIRHAYRYRLLHDTP